MDNLDEDLMDAHLKMVDNFGPAKDMFHPDYGWILKDGKLTPEGEKFYEEQRNRYGRSKG